MVAALNNTHHLKSCKHTDAKEDTHTRYLHDSYLIYGLFLTQTRRLWMLEMLSSSNHNMNGDKQVKDIYANISSAAQKILISDKINTQCDQWDSGKWTAFLHWLLNFLCCRLFLQLQDYYCSSVVINNGLGVCVACLQLHAPLILVSPSEQAWTTHPTSVLLSHKDPCERPRHPQRSTGKGQFNPNRSCHLSNAWPLTNKIQFDFESWGRTKTGGCVMLFYVYISAINSHVHHLTLCRGL